VLVAVRKQLCRVEEAADAVLTAIASRNLQKHEEFQSFKSIKHPALMQQ